jgi:hypothetical protein
MSRALLQALESFASTIDLHAEFPLAPLHLSHTLDSAAQSPPDPEPEPPSEPPQTSA